MDPPRIFAQDTWPKRAPNIESFATPSQANDWADQQSEPVQFFAWDKPVPEGFNGFAIEEIKYLRGEHGSRSRVWSMPADCVDIKPAPSMGKPIEAARKPFAVYESYEVRVRQMAS